jgi:hypothetical protein
MKSLSGERAGVSVLSDKDLRHPIVGGSGCSTCNPCGYDCDGAMEE